jgi:hypothetical protein
MWTIQRTAAVMVLASTALAGFSSARAAEPTVKLVVDVTRAIEKAQQAVARISPKVAAAASTPTAVAMMAMLAIATRARFMITSL